MSEATHTSLPIADKYELQRKFVASNPQGHDKNSVNRKDHTKKYLSRTVSNPCSYDLNMRSHGANNYVKHQLTFTGGIANFIEGPDFSQEPLRTTNAPVHVADVMCDPETLGEQAISRAATASKYKQKLNMINRSLSGVATRREPLRVQAVEPSPRKAPYATSSGKDVQEIEQRVMDKLMRQMIAQKPSAFRSREERLEMKDLVKDAVKEYFDSLNLPQGFLTERAAPAQYAPEVSDSNEREIWAVVQKPGFGQEFGRPSSRYLPSPSASARQGKGQYWKNDPEFNANLQSWITTAPSHEQEIVKNLLKKLNDGKTPAELGSKSLDGALVQSHRPSSFAHTKRGHGKIIPAQYQCDVSMFQKSVAPNGHFIISPEWTSERFTVKKVPAAHLHSSASLKNKLGLLRA